MNRVKLLSIDLVMVTIVLMSAANKSFQIHTGLQVYIKLLEISVSHSSWKACILYSCFHLSFISPKSIRDF